MNRRKTGRRTDVIAQHLGNDPPYHLIAARRFLEILRMMPAVNALDVIEFEEVDALGYMHAIESRDQSVVDAFQQSAALVSTLERAGIRQGSK